VESTAVDQTGIWLRCAEEILCPPGGGEGITATEVNRKIGQSVSVNDFWN